MQKGKKKTLFLGDPNHDFADDWRVDQLCSTTAMKQTFHVKNRIDAYLPLAVIVSYSILTKGFLWMKAGEEFEGYLFVNSSFNSDIAIEVGGYAKGLTFLDIGLKKKDVKKIKLNQITDLYESSTQQKCKKNDLILPTTATDTEILEFISMSYELFASASAKKIEVIKDFYNIYKKIGMSSNFERLTGEMLDRVYLPITLLEIAEAKVKKDGYQLKEQYYWDVLTPFPANEKKPLGLFLEMQLNARALIELLNISINLMKL